MKFLQRILRISQQYSAASIAVLVFLFIAFPNKASAIPITFGGVDTIASFVVFLLSWAIYYIFIWTMGVLSSYATQLLVFTAGLSGFTNSVIIIEAWGIVRDFSNMFFIVILLVIAFGTLFNVEAYSWKRLLPKMVIAAILVNYSRAIVGVFVDASQIIMLTFVQAIAPAAEQNFAAAFGLGDILTGGSTADAQAIGSTNKVDIEVSRLIAIIVAGVMLYVLVMVQLVYIVVLISRMVMIWFLTVLSPLAFTTMVLPATEKYFKQWTEMLARYIVLGPMIMFFLWLAMFISAKTSGKLTNIVDVSSSTPASELAVADGIAATKALSDGTVILGFIVSATMLMAGLKLAQDNSGEFGSYIGKAANISKAIAAAPAALGFNAARKVGGAGLTGAVDVLAGRGLDLNASRQWSRLQTRRQKLKQASLARGISKSSDKARNAGRLGMVTSALTNWDQAYENYMPFTGRRGVTGFAKRFVAGGKAGEDGARKDVETASNEVEKIQNSIGIQEEEVRSTHARQSEVSAVANRKKEIDNFNTTGMASGSVKNFKGTGIEGVINTAIASLKAKQKAETDTSKHAEYDSNIKALEVALKDDKLGIATLTNQGREAIKDAGGKAESQVDKDQAALGKTVVADDAYDNTVKAVIAQKVQSLQGQLAEAQDVQEAAKKRLRAVKAPDDPDAIGAFREAGREAIKSLESDNEDYLKDVLLQYKEEKDWPRFLAVMNHMAEKGHSNEVPIALGKSVSPAGMREIFEDLRDNAGVSEDTLLAEMEAFSSTAQNMNHWWGAQLVGYKNGKRTFREDNEIASAQRNEFEKAGANKIAYAGNRLAIGGYDDAGNYVLDSNKASIMAKNFHTFGELITRGRYNNSQAEHIADNEAMFRRLIRAMHQDPGTRQQALDNLTQLLTTTRASQGTAYNKRSGEEIIAAAKAAQEI